MQMLKEILIRILWLFIRFKEYPLYEILPTISLGQLDTTFRGKRWISIVYQPDQEIYSTGFILKVMALSVRVKNYLVGESLLVIITNFTKLVVHLLLFFICYVVFFGTIATIIVVPREELVQTLMTTHEYDCFYRFLSLPIDVQRNFCLWFFLLFVSYSNFYSKR